MNRKLKWTTHWLNGSRGGIICWWLKLLHFLSMLSYIFLSKISPSQISNKLQTTKPQNVTKKFTKTLILGYPRVSMDILYNAQFCVTYFMQKGCHVLYIFNWFYLNGSSTSNYNQHDIITVITFAFACVDKIEKKTIAPLVLVTWQLPHNILKSFNNDKTFAGEFFLFLIYNLQETKFYHNPYFLLNLKMSYSLSLK